MIQLRPVNDTDIKFLYDILLERDNVVSISHKSTPSWISHSCFVKSFPYYTWDIIIVNGDRVGYIYITHYNEIGIHICKKYRRRGIASQAIEIYKSIHNRERYLANINPNNKASINLFTLLGFTHIQNTYELCRQSAQ